MKRFYTIISMSSLLLFSSLTTLSWAQWTDISPNVADVLLFDVAFINQDVGFAVGQNTSTGMGYIFKTVDGGVSWTNKSFPDAHLRTVDFTDENNGIVSGYDGPPGTKIHWYRTSDQGVSWNNTTDNLYTGVNGLQFSDGQTGFAYGYGTSFGTNGGLLKTTDGGATWTHRLDEMGLLIEGMHFFDGTTGFISAVSFSGDGTIRKSTDGGLTFPIMYAGDWVRGITFVNNNVGFVVEGLSTRSLLKTIDGGNNWNALPIDDDVTRVLFITEDVGYAAGDNGVLFKTTDGGTTWVNESPGTTEDFESISTSGNHVYACGTGSTVYKAEHGLFTGIARNQNTRGEVVIAFPNPANQNSKIRFNGLSSSQFQFHLLTTSGQTVINTELNDAELDLSPYQLESGIYFYQIESKSGLFNGRFVID
jgi:photosystem II stability/assembly factor-like uncharacterized protein